MSLSHALAVTLSMVGDGPEAQDVDRNFLVGRTLSDLKIHRSHRIAARSFDDLRGRPALVAFYGSCHPNETFVATMNGHHDALADRGVDVVSAVIVTKESVTRIIKEVGLRTPYVSVDIDEMREFGIASSTFGYAALLGPTGEIVWYGPLVHAPVDTLLERVPDPAIPRSGDWPRAARHVARPVAEHRLGRALTESAEWPAEDQELSSLATALRVQAASDVTFLTELVARGDFLTASDHARFLEKAYAGSNVVEEIRAIRDELDDDARREIIEAQRAVRAEVRTLEKGGQIRRRESLSRLTDLRERYPDTILVKDFKHPRIFSALRPASQ